jgi:hypothetical protein
MSPEFHQTKRGQIFFDYQLPKLIDNIGRVADCLEGQEETKATPDTGYPMSGVVAKAPDKSEDLSVESVEGGYKITYKGIELAGVNLNKELKSIEIYTLGEDNKFRLSYVQTTEEV